MRCYFIRNGYIGAVEPLDSGSDDAVIEQAESRFAMRAKEFDGFEVWERERFVYRSPELPPAFRSAPTGKKSYYRLYLLGDDGIIRGYFDFSEESDEAAYEIAVVALDLCADRATQFELWHNAKRIKRPATIATMIYKRILARRRAPIVALVAIMRESRWAVASNKRLLARPEDIETAVVAATPQPVAAVADALPVP